MIQSIHKGRGFRGVLNYVMGVEKSAELVGGNMYGTDPRALASEFRDWRELRPSLGKAVFHSSLSLPYGGGGREELGSVQWQEVAQRYLEHLGYGRSPYIVVRHRDTEHDHVHIVAARIDADGRSVSDSNDYRRGEEVLRAIEKEYGLTPVVSAHEVDRSAMRSGEMRQLERSGEVSTRLRLQDLLDRAAADKPAMSRFLDRLEKAGVEAVPRVAKTGHVSGISYRLDGVAFRGSDLGRSYSWKGLQERLGIDYQSSRDLPTVRKAAERLASGRTPDRVTQWSPRSLAALQNELGDLSARKGQGKSSRVAVEGLARTGSEALAGPASAVRLLAALRSGRSATRFAVSRLPGSGVVTPLLDASRAVRSPIGLLLYGSRLATAAGRIAFAPSAELRSTPGARRVVAGYLRAAASDRPAMPVFLDRLRDAGVDPLPLLDRRGSVRAIAYRVGGEIATGQELGPAYTWSGLQRRLGVSYEPERDLPRISESRERPTAGVGRGRSAADRDPSPQGRAAGDLRRTRPARGSVERSVAAVGPEATASGQRIDSVAGVHVDSGRRPVGSSTGHSSASRVGVEPHAGGRPDPRPAHESNSRKPGRGREVGDPRNSLGGPGTAGGRDRLSEATLRASLERSGTPSLRTFHQRKAYAGNLDRADVAWATAALRGGTQPHLVLSEVAKRGAKASAAPEVGLGHATRVLVRALTTVKPGRSVEKTVSLAAQALAVVIKAPLAVVKALLIIRSIARELSQERGR